MAPDRISLDGTWDFQIDPTGGLDASIGQDWRRTTVPMPWQAQFEDLRLVDGVAWYRRTFVLDAEHLAWIGSQTAVLHYGAVNYQATVWLNDVEVGAHEGGYLPFEFDVASLLRPGVNELLVRVVDPSDDRTRFPDFPFSETPHGKQSWYGPIGGIWQSVWLEFRPPVHITRLALQPDPAAGAIALAVALNVPPQEGYRIYCRVVDPDGVTAGEVTLEQRTSGTLRLDAPARLWSPAAPNLYTVTAVLHQAGAPPHTVSATCGFRTVEARDGRIYLNGEPLYLRGVLDQAYYPETIYTPPSAAFLEDQARKIKALGFNCLRLHIKIEDPVYYDVADRVGLLVWTEIPNWGYLSASAAARARETFQGMVERDGNHPSIIAWTLVNENWGMDLTRNPAHRQWLRDFYDAAKAMDPTRLIVDNSACPDNFHVAGDIEDYHQYQAIPDHAAEWDAWVADFAGRSDWAWAEDFAAERRPDLPLLVSEFGNWGLPDPAEVDEHGREPWWFETGSEWDGGSVYPHGVTARFAACGLADLFADYGEFARHAQAHMARSLHYEITSMRLHADIGGYVITECTDVHWECNGLLTMQRQVKHLLDPILKQVNQDRALLLRPDQWSAQPDAPITVTVRPADVAGAVDYGCIRWQADDQTGEFATADVETLTFIPTKPGLITLQAQWIDDAGNELARNAVEIACVETPQFSGNLCVPDDDELAQTLQALGYAVTRVLPAQPSPQSPVIVARRYTREVSRALHQGGRVLLLAHAPETPPGVDSLPLPYGRVIPREGTTWQGDWATSFAWLKRTGPFARLAGPPLLEMDFAPVMPDVVLAGLPSWALRTASWAGLAVGWVHAAVSLLACLEYGKGRLAVTTFKLHAGTLADNVIAQALFVGALELLDA
ncbi:MAG: hypothetical protein KDD92_08765 [Caldilineaceae bacterium]|nr:hypothetical protein [Caldilineaceae bacterium]